MASDILNSELTLNVKVDKKSKTIKTQAAPEPKTTSSMFDNILSKAKQQNTTTAITATNTKNLTSISKISSKTIDTKNIQDSNTLDLNKKTGNSLLDNMIRNIKSTKNISSVELKKETSIGKTPIAIEKNLENKTNTNETIKKPVKVLIASSEEKVEKIEKVIKDTSTKIIEEKVDEVVKSKVLNSIIDKTNKSYVNVDKILENKPKKSNDAKIASNTTGKTNEITKDKTQKIKTSASLIQTEVKSLKNIIIETEENKEIKTVKNTSNTILESISKTTDTIKILNPESTGVIDTVKITETSKNENVSKENISNTNVTEDSKAKTSLMDNLLKDVTNTVSKNKTEDHGVKSTNITSNVISKKDSLLESETPLKARMFLAEQNTQKELLSNQKINEVKSIIKDEKSTLSNVKKASDVLELNAGKMEVKKVDNSKEEKVVSKTVDDKIFTKNIKEQSNLLDKVFLNKVQNIESSSEEKINEIKAEKIVESKSLETKIIKSENDVVKNDVKIFVEQNLANNITNKIIGARQKMDSMMSEVARNMYLNYKPPVTAFKISLNPMNLGNIAVTMRSSKADNSITVSLNMSQSSTLEAFSDNKTLLQNALKDIFNNQANFSLNFNMQDDSSNNSFEQEQNKAQENVTTNNIIEERLNNEESLNKDQSYM